MIPAGGIGPTSGESIGWPPRRVRTPPLLRRGHARRVEVRYVFERSSRRRTRGRGRRATRRGSARRPPARKRRRPGGHDRWWAGVGALDQRHLDLIGLGLVAV